ncbi:hypothetical protein NQ318_003323 [Aromia moschata]|uniref:Uncharacterized protein n=1 Tax=Aromia moschata TaxID=1265417 RepID=A0AAV8YNP6_9CUCU|nr:hypothetical protein NQ318_003323 [Aromia moschata]
MSPAWLSESCSTKSTIKVFTRCHEVHCLINIDHVHSFQQGKGGNCAERESGIDLSPFITADLKLAGMGP